VLARLEAVALAVHLQDVHAVGEAVQQRAGQPFRPQHFGQLLKGQVAGHQRRATLVPTVVGVVKEQKTSSVRTNSSSAGNSSENLTKGSLHGLSAMHSGRPSCRYQAGVLK